MASAQVLPSSRKQGHLEAGKRRLEEFRKKKAADRAKKAAATSQVHVSDVHANEKQPSNVEVERPPVSDDAETSVVQSASNERQPSDTEVARPPLSDSSGTSIMPNVSINPFETQGNKEKQSDLEISVKSYNGLPYKFSSDQPIPLRTQPSQEIGSSSSQSSFNGKEESLSNEGIGSLKGHLFTSLGTSLNTVASNSSNSSGSNLLPTDRSDTSSLRSGQTTSYSNEGFAFQSGGAIGPSNDVKTSNLENGTYSNIFIGGSGSQMNDPSTAFPTGLSDSLNQIPPFSATGEAQPRRSRPSFLDSLNVSRAPPIFLKSSESVDSATSSRLTSNSTSFIGSSVFQAQHPESEDLGPLSKFKVHDVPRALELSSNSSLPVNNGENFLRLDANGGDIERKPDLFSHKQNEDFAALEQHIEDLTQEKFSLQRALEASRSLADSLATENSSLTDNYNQQRGVVNQLKADMEKLQEEINAQMAQLEFIKQEYANAQLECNAADERAKLLASEVIGLEEKALRLRSNELKLERQLENSQEEISLCRKKLSSLEKERQDLQLTISALQEEKKLLQSKLRKASAGGKSLDHRKSTADSKDMSTSTEDLETPEEQIQSTGSIVGSDTSSSILHLDIEASSMYLPPDQIRTIENINTLIVELAMEKDVLLKALASETSENSKLMALNKELSQKLEAQTQRLELLTAQSMTSESIPPLKQLDSHAMHETAAYADEGDEVVERVLGWIMKLFPGGPSRRRTSKLL